MTGAEVGAADGPSAVPAVIEQRSPEWLANRDRMDLARALARSEAIPKRYWGRPDDVFATIIHGAEMGLTPSIALKHIYMIDGTPTFSAAFVLALMLRGGFVQFRERSAERVVVTGRRPNGSHLTVEWTWEMAKTADLAGKQTWKRYPRQMLTARAVTELGRLLFADDVVLGAAYTPEEVGHIGPYDVIDVDDSYAEPLDVERPANVDENGVIADEPDVEDATWVAQARADELEQREDAEQRRIESAFDPDPEAG